MPQNEPILAPFDALLRAAPTKTIVSGEGRRASASDLDALARAAAGARTLAPPRGTLVAMAAPDGPGFLAALLALLRLGCPAVLLDAWSPAAERRRIGTALGAAALLECTTPWPSGPSSFVWTALPTAAPAVLEDVAVVKLTSGSTGAPRGVAASAAALAADDDDLWRTMGLGDDDRLLSAVPLGHSYGLSSLTLPALRRGAPLLLPTPGSPFAALDAAVRDGATFFPTTPAWVGGLLRLSSPPEWPETLRLTISAGAPLAPEVASRFREVFGRPIHTFYGSSECGGICYDRAGDAAERGTVGAPVDGVRIEVVPLERGGAGKAGAVHVRSAAVCGGYWPHPDPRLEGGRFVAGDLGRWEGEELALEGRVDDLLNVHGKKVSPREVEATIRELPGVEDVVVFGAPHAVAGHVVCAAVAADPARLRPDEIALHCRARLAAHKRPRGVFVLAELPRTPRGKIDRAALLSLGAPLVAADRDA